MASRLCGLKFGRLIFESGISGSAGPDHGSEEPPLSIWCGTTARLERYYRSCFTVLPLGWYCRWLVAVLLLYAQFRLFPTTL